MRTTGVTVSASRVAGVGIIAGWGARPGSSPGVIE